MTWIIYWPVILVILVAVVAGIAVLVRKLRGSKFKSDTGRRAGQP